MAFKYSVSGITLGFLGYDFTEEPEFILKSIKDAGFDGIDVFDNPNKRNAEQIRQIVDSLSLKVPEVLGNWGGDSRDLAGGDGDTRKKAVEYAKEVIDYCVNLNSSVFGLCLPQPSVTEAPISIMPVNTLKRNLVDGLKEICAYAAERKVTVVIEPLNCYESYPCLMNTLKETMNVIKELDCDNIGLQPDVFHMNIGETSITDAIKTFKDDIVTFHMNETNHFKFGSGHADVKAIMKTLKTIGFSGYMTIYMPLMTRKLFNMSFRGIVDEGTSPAKPDLNAVLTETIEYIRSVEAEIEEEKVSR